MTRRTPEIRPAGGRRMGERDPAQGGHADVGQEEVKAAGLRGKALEGDLAVLGRRHLVAFQPERGRRGA